MSSGEQLGARQERGGAEQPAAPDRSPDQAAPGRQDTAYEDSGSLQTDLLQTGLAEGRRQWFRERIADGTFAEHLETAGVFITNQNGEVLTFQAARREKRTILGIPGDYVENGPRTKETPRGAAARVVGEVREELGVDLTITGLLVVNERLADPERADDHPLTNYIYGAIIPKTSETQPDGEDAGNYAFLPPEEAVEALGPGRADVAAAIEALRSKKTLRLMDWKPL